MTGYVVFDLVVSVVGVSFSQPVMFLDRGGRPALVLPPARH
jgi:hypothetical protein